MNPTLTLRALQKSKVHWSAAKSCWQVVPNSPKKPFCVGANKATNKRKKNWKVDHVKSGPHRREIVNWKLESAFLWCRKCTLITFYCVSDQCPCPWIMCAVCRGKRTRTCCSFSLRMGRRLPKWQLDVCSWCNKCRACKSPFEQHASS